VLTIAGSTWTRDSDGVAIGAGTCHATTVDTTIARKFYGDGWRTWVVVGTTGYGNLYSRDTDAGDYEAQMYGGANDMSLDVSIGSASGVWTANGRWRGTSTLKVLAIAYNMQATPSGVAALRQQQASGSTWRNDDNGNIPLALASGWNTKQARVFQPADGTRGDLGNWGGRILRLATAPGIADLAAIHAWAASLGVTGL
jgi:hypothetical protein